MSKITINIITCEDKSKSKVTVSGSDVAVVGNKEIKTFQLHEDKLKTAVEKYDGSYPSYVFVKSPTDGLFWLSDNLYKSYNWKPVTRTIKPLRGKILSINRKPIIVQTQIFKNISSTPLTCKTSLRQNIENTITSTWETKNEFNANFNISYIYDVKAFRSEGSSTFNYNSCWGESVKKSKIVSVGSEIALEKVLQENQSAVAELFAIKESMKIQIDYETTLDGSVTTNYALRHKNHFIWAYNINNVLKAGGMKTSVLSSEVITLDYHCDTEAHFRDL